MNERTIIFIFIISILIILVRLFIQYVNWKNNAIELEDSIFLADYQTDFIDKLPEGEIQSKLQIGRLNVEKRIKNGKADDVLFALEVYKCEKEKPVTKI